METVKVKKEFTIYTAMGRSTNWDKLGLTSNQITILNNIGYGNEKEYGRGANGFENYLNTLNNNSYSVSLTKSDTGDFSETFKVELIREVETENNTFIGYLGDTIDILKNRNLDVYVKVIVQDASELLKEKEKNNLFKKKEDLLKQLKKIDEELSKFK